MSYSDVTIVDYYTPRAYKIHTYGDGTKGRVYNPIISDNILQLRTNLDNCKNALEFHANKSTKTNADGSIEIIQSKGSECHANASTTTDGFAPDYTYALLDSYAKQLDELNKIFDKEIFPPYSIVIWDGARDTVPSNWIICDGSVYTYVNSAGKTVSVTTPNLEGRIPIGSGGRVSKGQYYTISGASPKSTTAKLYIMKKCPNGYASTVNESKKYSLTVSVTTYMSVTVYRADTRASKTLTNYSGVVWSDIPRGTAITVSYSTVGSYVVENNWRYPIDFNYFRAKEGSMSSYADQKQTIYYYAQDDFYVQAAVTKAVSRGVSLYGYMAFNASSSTQYFTVPQDIYKVKLYIGAGGGGACENGWYWRGSAGAWTTANTRGGDGGESYVAGLNADKYPFGGFIATGGGGGITDRGYGGWWGDSSTYRAATLSGGYAGSPDGKSGSYGNCDNATCSGGAGYTFTLKNGDKYGVYGAGGSVTKEGNVSDVWTRTAAGGSGGHRIEEVGVSPGDKLSVVVGKGGSRVLYWSWHEIYPGGDGIVIIEYGY